MGSLSGSTTSPSSSSSSSAASNESRSLWGVHMLLRPVTGAQRHINPMLQLGRRPAHHGLRPTLVSTRCVHSTTDTHPLSPFRVDAISDGFNDCGADGRSCSEPPILWPTPRAAASCAGSCTTRASRGRVGWRASRAAAALLSQPCSVDLIYGELWAGRLSLPVTDGVELYDLLGVYLGHADVTPFPAKPAGLVPYEHSSCQ
nr:UDP-glucosyltransferase UGT13248-like [Setaria viridis]